jgi:NAD(P)-dependent dehydrogenase (short-subunit alcohol dehydrogenase family)
MTKVAIITGGASGIGFATTQLLACAGYRVGIADLNTPLAIDRVAELTGSGYEAFQLSLDVTNREECGTALEKVRHQHGLVTLVVNCAGVAGRSQIGDAASGAGWDRNIDINLTGSFNMVHGCIGQLKASGKGVVVNVSSVVGERSGFAEAGLCSLEGRRDRADAAVVPRTGAVRNPGELRRAGLHRDADAGQQPWRCEKLDGYPYADEASWPAARDCRGHRVPCLGCRQLHQRRHPSGRWRISLRIG